MFIDPIVITQTELQRTEEQLRDFEVNCSVIDAMGTVVVPTITPEPVAAFEDE